MLYPQYNDPLHIVWRKGDESDPYVEINQSHKIVNNIIILREIPDELTGVSVSDYVEVKNGILLADQFTVDYNKGIITFNSSEESKTVAVDYKGRGIISYPAERIYLHTEGGIDLTKNLQQVIDSVNPGIEALALMESKMNDVNDSIENSETATANANEATSNANVAIENANTARDSANTSAANADNKAAYAQAQGDHARVEGDYAKAQGDYAKSSADELTFLGEYSGEISYKLNNSIRYNNAIYRCILESTGNLPTNPVYWIEVLSVASEVANAEQAAIAADTATANANIKIGEMNTKISAANAATTAANTARDNANLAADNADTATAAAESATTSANTATANAIAATGEANTARDEANAARDSANLAASNADTARAATETATTNANTATANVIAATGEANTARDEANAARDSANLAASNADTARAATETATTSANTATANAIAATEEANTARDEANTARDSANLAASNADTARVATETATTNANTATANAIAATSNANTATGNANSSASYAENQGNYALGIASEVRHLGEYTAAISYQVNNSVRFNGSTYICIANCTGIAPNNNANWELLALKGYDGVGNVDSVNGYGGAVVLNATDVGAIDIAEKGVMSGVATLNSNGKIPLNQIPDISKQQTYIVANSAERNALTGMLAGDKAYETATGDSYIYSGSSWLVWADADWANVNIDWSNITNPPASYTPVAHNHAVSEITDFDPATKADKNGVLQNNLNADMLDGKQATDFTPASHATDTGNPHGVTAAQVGAARLTHNHAVSEITDFDPATKADKNGILQNNLNADLLDGKQASQFAPIAHQTNNTNPHSVTTAQIGAETPAGAQAKANSAEQNARNYTNSELNNKVDKVTGKGLSKNDYTDAEKTKVANSVSHIANLTNPHGATAEATSNKIMARDSNGKTKLNGLILSDGVGGFIELKIVGEKLGYEVIV